MKFLIACLGNIGDEYENTRHNIGFKVGDMLAEKFEAEFTSDRHANVCKIKSRGRQYVLIKPTTFMNLSGKAVKYWMTAEKITASRLLVITDDIALPFGKIRIRPKGSDGGHNGLKSIIEVLGNGNFPRLRFGVGSDFSKGAQADYVLGKWDEKEKAALPELIQKSSDAVLSMGFIGLPRTMNKFNG